MQLFSRNKALVALSLSALTVLGACGDDVTVSAPAVTPESVTISPANLSLNQGEVGTLAVQINGGTGTPTLTSCTASSAIITVAANAGNCRVTAVSPGNATVTALSSGGKSASASVTVNSLAPAIVGLSVTPAAANIAVGGTQAITANPTTQATGATIARQFVSSNTAVATVNATTGVVTAVAPGSATITVTLTGSGTGLTTATVTGQVAITVTALPAGITALMVAPSSVAVLPGQTQALVPTATTAAGVTATYSYVSSNTGVASVSSTGVVTGVAPGAATITVTATSAATSAFSASTITASVPVNTIQRAQIAVGNITTGQTNNPVDIANVNGQIQVALNLDVGGQIVTATNVCIFDAATVTTATGCTAAQAAARQTYGSGGASTGIINAFINTADFLTSADSGTATALFTNGQKIFVASFEAAGSGSTATPSQVVYNFTNMDGFAAFHRAPARSAVANGTAGTANLTFFGGPGTAGQGSVIVAPVMYTQGRTIARATVQLNGAPCGNQSYTFVTGTDARPWRITYGTGTTAATFFGCSGATNAANGASGQVADLDVFPIVTASIDNSQNPGPTASTVLPSQYNPVIPTGPTSLFRTSTTAQTGTTMPVGVPGRIRADYQGPSVSVVYPTTQDNGTRWSSVAANYSFRNGFSFGDGTGVGFASTSATTNRTLATFTFSGCGNTAVGFDGTTGSNAIPECATNFQSNVYVVNATLADALGNSTTSSDALSSGFGIFAIDNTAPQLRYTASTDSLTIYNAAPAVGVTADTMFSSESLDDRSGLNVSNAAAHLLARSNQATANGACLVGTGTIGALFNTAPGCTPANAGFTGTVLPDGFRPINGVLFSGVAGTQGYYTYRVQVTDRAGNTTQREFRQALINTTAPAISGLGIAGASGIVTALGPNNFTPNFAETVEAFFTNFRISFAGLRDSTNAGTAEASLLYPANPVELASAAVYTNQFGRWNNVTYLNGNVITATPFTSGTNFYTNLEFTRVNGRIDSVTANTIRPDSVGARVANVGNLVSNLYSVQLLGPNVNDDATRWSSKNGNIISWILGTDAAQWNAPANGVKALVTASSNQINSPFGRVDFYEFIAGNWRFLGSVNGQATPSTSPAGAGPVYISDNGATRTWTYRLTTAACDSVTVGCTGVAQTTVAGRRIIAVATDVAGSGRALSTNTASAASTVASTAPSSWTANPVFGYTNATIAQGTTAAAQNVTTQPTLAAAGTFGAPSTPVYTCQTSNSAVANCTINSTTGALTVSVPAGVTVGSTATITVFVTSAPTNGFAGAAAVTSITITTS